MQACSCAAALAPRLALRDLSNILAALGRAVHTVGGGDTQRIRAAGQELLDAITASPSS